MSIALYKSVLIARVFLLVFGLFLVLMLPRKANAFTLIELGDPLNMNSNTSVKSDTYPFNELYVGYINEADAKKIGITFGQVDIGYKHIYFIEQFLRYKKVGDKKIGFMARCTLSISTKNTTLVANLPWIAAQAQINRDSIRAEAKIDAIGLDGIKIIEAMIYEPNFNVESYTKIHNAFENMKNMTADPSIAVDPQDIEPAKPSPINFEQFTAKNALLVSWSLARIADGNTCEDAIKKYIKTSRGIASNDDQEFIRSFYRYYTNTSSDTDLIMDGYKRSAKDLIDSIPKIK